MIRLVVSLAAGEKGRSRKISEPERCSRGSQIIGLFRTGRDVLNATPSVPNALGGEIRICKFGNWKLELRFASPTFERQSRAEMSVGARSSVGQRNVNKSGSK